MQVSIRADQARVRIQLQRQKIYATLQARVSGANAEAEQETRLLELQRHVLRDAERSAHILPAELTGVLSWQVLHQLAKALRLKGRKRLAYEYAQAALGKVEDPRDSWLPYEEIALSADDAVDRRDVLHACEAIILSPDAEPYSRDIAIQNVTRYIDLLPARQRLAIGCEIPPKYNPANPSIIRTTNGYLCNVRCVNYLIHSKGRFTINDPYQVARTRNFLVTLDEKFKAKRQVELMNKSPTPLYLSRVVGLEDIRLFGDRYFFCTCLEVNKWNIPQTCWGTYDREGKVSRLVPLQVGEKLQIEKNWLPFMTKDGKLRFVYSVGPLRMFEVAVDGTITEIVNRSLTEAHVEEFRGSGSPIPYKGGWLATIHQVQHTPPRRYLHRLVWFDQDFTRIRYGPLFCFTEPKIEYNLAICHSPNGLVVTYSVNDASAMLAVVDYAVVDEHLKHSEKLTQKKEAA